MPFGNLSAMYSVVVVKSIQSCCHSMNWYAADKLVKV